VTRFSAAIALTVVVAFAAGCSSDGADRAEQNSSIAEQAGLPKDVADFFALTAKSTDATYKVSVKTTDKAGSPVQITTSQRPPDRRIDVFSADGTIDATIATGGDTFQCTQLSGQWQCGQLDVVNSEDDSDVLGADTVRQAAERFQRRAADYDFRIEQRTIANATATCLVTNRKPGHDEDPSLGASATLCLSAEGVPLLVEVPTGSVNAVDYSTDVPEDAFDLPAVPAPPTVPGARPSIPSLPSAPSTTAN
jgi:hypothetical protein